MKKLILVLTVALIASPVFAALDVSLVRNGNDVDVVYTGADSANLPRAFALDLQFTSGATFTGFVAGSYLTGESNAPNHRGFGIYPASITIDSTGSVGNYGNPLAVSGDPGTTGTFGFGTNHIILEFGSLYFNDANAPATSGTLCKLAVSAGSVSNPVITMTDEATYRGGIVLEDGTTNLTAGDESFTYTTLQAPGKATLVAPAPTGATGISRTLDLSWTAGTDATSRDVYFGTVNPPVTKVINNGTAVTYDTGTMAQAKTYYWRVDEKNSVGTTTGDLWSFTVQECLKTTDTGYSYWKFLGKPDCWCFKRQCRGDSTGTVTLGKPVAGNDLTNFQMGFNKATTILSGLKDGNGFYAICADYTHSVTLGKPVAGNDLTQFQLYFNKATTSVPQCVGTNINFWMN